jgi:Putative beta barrel porin-7 (BBP7)
MRYGTVGSFTALVAGAGMALAQTPAGPPPSAQVPPAPAVAPTGLFKSTPKTTTDPAPAFALPDFEYGSSPPGTALPPAIPARQGFGERNKSCEKPEGNTDKGGACEDPNAFDSTPAAPPRLFSHDPGGLFGPSMKPEEPHVPHQAPDRFWAAFDYLYWYGRNDAAGPLVTTGTSGSRGIPGQPGTTVLYDHLGYGGTSGLRLTAGYDDPEDHCGIEATGFVMENRHDQFFANSGVSGLPLLARGITNSATGQASAVLVAFPGAFSGPIATSSESQLWGAGADYTCQFYCDPCKSAEFLVGFRYIDFREQLNIGQNTQILPGGISGLDGTLVLSPNALLLAEQFRTSNQYYGGELGARGELNFGNFFLNGTGKVALGVNNEVANIAGTSSVISPNGTTVTVPGGIVAVSNNIGRATQNRFCVVPEVDVNLGFNLTCWARLYVGYTFIYMSDVARPGDLSRTPTNPSQIPTSLNFGIPLLNSNPASGRFSSTEYWIQGFNAGLALRY